MAEEQKVTLNINDILVATNILRLATRRGAFELEETKTVSAVVDRFTAFLNANAPKPETAANIESPTKESK